MPEVFLYAPQDFHNVCLLARTLEAFGYRECFVFDSHRLFRERYGKSRSRELRVVSKGAFEKVNWLRVEDPVRLLSEHAGSVVATVASPGAVELAAHEFARDDLIVFGPETHGLPAELIAQANVALTIPLSGETRSLNLAVAFGIVLFEAQRQLTRERPA